MNYTDVPPLLAMVLRRCSRPGELIDRVLELREEWAGAREAVRRLERQLHEAASFRDHMEVVRDLEQMQSALARKLDSKRQPRKGWVRRLWGYAKPGAPWGIITKVLDDLLDWDRERQILSISYRFVDLFDTLYDGDVGRDVSRVFGDVRNETADEARLRQRLGQIRRATARALPQIAAPR